MPLDSHDFLVSQGWQGKGSALRQGGLSRAIAIPQKRTLAGVGKDRDEAFPFWEHLFSAASKSIQIKISSDDDEDPSPTKSEPATLHLQRTKTGILSNRRPTNLSSPLASDPDSDFHQFSLLTAAKRQAARQGLYARFFRGPILTSESESPTPPHTVIPKSHSTEDIHSSQKMKKPEDSRKSELSHIPISGMIAPNKPPLDDSVKVVEDANPTHERAPPSKEELKKSKREAKREKKQARELALAWMKNVPQTEDSEQYIASSKKRKRKETSMADI